MTKTKRATAKQNLLASFPTPSVYDYHEQITFFQFSTKTYLIQAWEHSTCRLDIRGTRPTVITARLFPDSLQMQITGVLEGGGLTTLFVGNVCI